MLKCKERLVILLKTKEPLWWLATINLEFNWKTEWEVVERLLESAKSLWQVFWLPHQWLQTIIWSNDTAAREIWRMEKDLEKKVGIVQKFILAEDRMMWGGFISPSQQIVAAFQTLPKAVSCPCQITAPGGDGKIRGRVGLEFYGWASIFFILFSTFAWQLSMPRSTRFVKLFHSLINQPQLGWIY